VKKNFVTDAMLQNELFRDAPKSIKFYWSRTLACEIAKQGGFSRVNVVIKIFWQFAFFGGDKNLN
jgi:hypothetical protein